MAARRGGGRPFRKILAGGMIVVGGLLLLAVIGLLIVPRLGRQTPELNGALIDPPVPAPDFQLTDQSAQPVRMSQFRGNVVVLTFLYTNCPDACPLITAKLHQAYDLLGPDARRTTLLAVTVDPERDTVARVRAYSEEKDMLNRWHFLVGSRDVVAPVWTAYGAGPAVADYTAAVAQATAVAQGTPAPSPVTSTGEVDHTAPIFLVDPSGQLRVVLDINASPSDVVDDVRALLASPGTGSQAGLTAAGIQ